MMGEVLNSVTKVIPHPEPQIWEIVPVKIKSFPSLITFKKAMKKWQQGACSRRLFKTYMNQIGCV